ncbi:MAG: hypothetical protein NVS9B12_10180 [Vulcanimicrobiaceae bacterium]
MQAGFAGALPQSAAGRGGAAQEGTLMWIPLVLAALAFATPVPPSPVPAGPPAFKHLSHVHPALVPGATARVGERGNNIPCWDSPTSLTAFTQAYRSGDRATLAMQVASDSFLLEEGTRVRAIATQGMLGQILRLRMLDGEHAGTVCYIQASLKLYTAIQLPAPHKSR